VVRPRRGGTRTDCPSSLPLTVSLCLHPSDSAARHGLRDAGPNRHTGGSGQLNLCSGRRRRRRPGFDFPAWILRRKGRRRCSSGTAVAVLMACCGTREGGAAAGRAACGGVEATTQGRAEARRHGENAIRGGGRGRGASRCL